MKKPSAPILIALVFSFVPNAFGQKQEPITRPRTVTTAPAKQVTAAPAKQIAKAQAKTDEPQAPPARTTETDKTNPTQQPIIARENSSSRLSPSKIHQRIEEAERMLKTRPHPTALATPAIDTVTIAAMLPDSHIHLFRISKDLFLTKGSEIPATSTDGLPVMIRVIRANGVNTAVTIFDDKNRSLTPLLVEFPIERRGVFREMAYYTSAHPALLSNDLTKSGQVYVNSMVDLAAKRLKDKGFPVTSNLIEIAKRLCIVEHVDHDRFRNDNRIALYDEIYTLYALNELHTYRYSVSSAGAGGMVQMIPWTYNLMRQRHPGIGLNPDFVLGMRNHGNALEAMLLYMQDTWNDLVANEDVITALSEKQITPSELMAAGYNSNAAKIPGYIRRGGSGWRYLIPRETQIYLQIYQSLDVLSKAKANHAQKK
ncbi:MAG TPA: hypothetical protein VGP81_08505 [Pyrinomonadaceae bacterium]|jgi:hypothetical protein|nr:hypothetical protein [Pyrinomonadaceae bacterium]